ncbi:unnamed protein product [Macrosiphum euphorbiae]|uniref:Uncharacterized protein n=1 Tax=Macrosiphum euphorbiae TaxID=13131 RepID=A0AAV0WIL6_9HEMI|nr:unnamed protein product [Macrosiphum euphorbiae]
MRAAISAEERLIATLRFLSTGRSYEDLKFSTCISAPSLSFIIPETCKAIFDALKMDYMKVIINIFIFITLISLRYVQRERGEREFANDANEFALAAFAARNRVLPICGEREFAADNIPIFFVFWRSVVQCVLTCNVR